MHFGVSLGSGHRYRRLHYRYPRSLRQLESKGSKLDAGAGAEHGAVVDEEGAVGAERSRHGSQVCVVDVEREERAEQGEGEGRVGRSASQPGAVGDHFVEMHLYRRERRHGAQGAHGTHHQIFLRRALHPPAGDGERIVGARSGGDNLQDVAPCNRHHHSAEIVVAVGSAAQYVEANVDLGVGKCYHRLVCEVSECKITQKSANVKNFLTKLQPFRRSPASNGRKNHRKALPGSLNPTKYGSQGRETSKAIIKTLLKI